MRIVFGAGGSGGHIIPAIAIAQKLGKENIDCAFIGNRNSLEERLCKDAGFPVYYINVQKMYRKLTLSHIKFPILLIMSVISSMRHLSKLKADAVFCTGGYVSGPIAIAAIICRIPLFFHESNSFPGIVIRFLSKFSVCTFVAFESTVKHLANTRTMNVGIPIKGDLLAKKTFDPLRYNLSGEKPIILIIGGSQGSFALNKIIEQALPQFLEHGFELIWQTGAYSYKEFASKFSKISGTYLFDFTTDLPLFYQNANVAITRAGAMTIAELEAVKLPAILIPLPSSAENHQFHNAIEQQKKGCALLIEQKNLTTDSLMDCLNSILSNYDEYKKTLLSIPENNAADVIARQLYDYLGARSKRC